MASSKSVASYIVVAEPDLIKLVIRGSGKIKRRLFQRHAAAFVELAGIVTDSLDYYIENMD